MPKLKFIHPPRRALRYLSAGLLAVGVYLLRRRSRKDDPSDRTLSVSSPEQQRPTLIDFTDLNEKVDYSDRPLPHFPDDPTAVGNYRLLELGDIDADTFFVHVYNGSLAELPLQVYGVMEEEARPLLEAPTVIDKVAQRVEVDTSGRRYRRYFVRFALGKEGSYEFRKSNTISLAVYQTEPKAEGGIQQGETPLPVYEQKQPLPGELRKGVLAFSHERDTFQSVVLSSCEEDFDLEAWAKNTGLEITDSYFGPLGSVIVLGLTPGLSPNTSGGKHIKDRIEQQTTGGTASANYVVNQYDPTDPQRLRDCSKPLPSTKLPLEPYRDFDPDAEPVTVAVIDGGIDTSPATAPLWAPTAYTRGKQTPFVKHNALGYDFIERDGVPQDETAHGTYVAGTVVGGYRGKRPLQLVHFKVFGAEGISSYFGALVSIYEAATIGSDVINMSWGMYADDDPPGMRCAVEAAIRQGCYLVASAGNDARNLDKGPQWPAAFAKAYPKNFVSVASYRYTGTWGRSAVELSDFSNYGSNTVTVAAYEAARVPQAGTKDTATPRGTSISAALVSATLAQLLDSSSGAGGQIGKLYQLFDHNLTPSGSVSQDSVLPVSKGADTGLDAEPTTKFLVTDCGED